MKLHDVSAYLWHNLKLLPLNAARAGNKTLKAIPKYHYGYLYYVCFHKQFMIRMAKHYFVAKNTFIAYKSNNYIAYNVAYNVALYATNYLTYHLYMSTCNFWPIMASIRPPSVYPVSVIHLIEYARGVVFWFVVVISSLHIGFMYSIYPYS